MNIVILLGALIGLLVSIAALYACIELSVAYWQPRRAGARWLALAALPKLEYFRASLRFIVPIIGAVMLLQAVVSLRVLLAILDVLMA